MAGRARGAVMWRVRVTLAVPPGADVRAEWTRLTEVLGLESLLLPWLEDVAAEGDEVEGAVVPEATVVAGSAVEAEALLTGLVRGMTRWTVVGVRSEAI